MGEPDPKAKLEGSILISMMKRLIGDAEDLSDTSYAEDIMQEINANIIALTQKGIGPKEGFMISDETATWEDFLGEDVRLNCAKEYIYLKCKLGFDPPPAAAIESFEKNALENLTRAGYVVEFPMLS